MIYISSKEGWDRRNEGSLEGIAESPVGGGTSASREEVRLRLRD